MNSKKGKNNADNNGGANNNNNNNNNGGGNNNSNNNNNDNNNGGGGNNSNNNGGGEYLNIVLKVDFHCHGCANKIRKVILSYPGVRLVDLEGENKVKIMAMKNVEVMKMRETVEKKLAKKVELISPQPSKNDAQKKENNADQKPKEPTLTTVVLKIPYHCHGCGEKTNKAISSYKGVYEVKIDKEKELVTVKGVMNSKTMVDDLKKKLKKSIEIVPEKKDQNKKDGGDNNKASGNKQEGRSGGGGGGGKGSQKGGEKGCSTDYYAVGSVYEYGYKNKSEYEYEYARMMMMAHAPAPQLFSDENPNACSVM